MYYSGKYIPKMYWFPKNKQAAMNKPLEQAQKVREEAKELEQAIKEGDTDHILREAWDVIQAAEGVLRYFTADIIEMSWQNVFQRCGDRGDYTYYFDEKDSGEIDVDSMRLSKPLDHCKFND